jgi:hypothetical protein
MVDPMKVEAIIWFCPPCNIQQLQGLQGKDNFLCHFIVNYANIIKGFMRLLKKDTLFIWDEQAQKSFDALKKSLVSVSLRIPQTTVETFFFISSHLKGLLVWYLFRRMMSFMSTFSTTLVKI